MRRHLTVTTSTLLALLMLSLAANAQDEPDEPSNNPPAELRIESVDVSDYPDVRLTVGVTGHPDGPLPADAFAVLEDGESRQPPDVAYADSSDLQVLLLIDTTGSMGGSPMAGAKSAATTFVSEMPDEVALSILEYDADVRVVTGFAASRDEHLAGIDGLIADGVTATYDAVLTAIETFPESDDANRVIILLTDGEDNASEHPVDDAVDALMEADVTLHSIEYLTAYHEAQAVRAMANATGGAVTRADDVDELATVYEQLAADLVSRYRITYTSESNGRIDLDVEVDHDGSRATGRRTITLPSAVVEPPEEPERSDVAPPVVTEPPTIPPAEPALGRAAMLWGVGLWFAALAIVGLVFFAPRERRAQLAGMASQTTRRKGGMTTLANRASLVAERSLDRRGYQRGLNAALERAGIDLRPGEVVVLVGCAAITAGAVGRLMHGWLMAVVFVVLTIVFSRFLVAFLARRRQARFADQLGETLQLLSGSLRAGYSLMQAVDSVAREAPSPTAEEFGRLVVETRLGREMTESLHAMAERMESDDFSWVMQAIEIHREVGGDLAEVLDNVATTIRERNQIRRQVKALSAEGKLSAYVLIALPFGVGGFIALGNPAYLAELPNGGLLGWGMLAMGAVLMTAGIIWMRNLVKLRF